MNRILVEAGEVGDDGAAALRDGRFVHIRDVLHAQAGDRLRAGIIGGSRYDAEVLEMGAGGCVLRLVDALEPLAAPTVDLVLALPRPKCLKRLWPQLAAIGIRRLFIVNAERVEKHYWGSRLLEPAEYMPLVVEGLAQAGDTRVPEIRIVRRLKPLVEDELRVGYPEGCKWVAHPDRDGAGGGAMRFGGCGNVLLAVGPEGGWSAFELKLFEDSGFQRLGLGERTLRSDTACIALVAVAAGSRHPTFPLFPGRKSGRISSRA